MKKLFIFLFLNLMVLCALNSKCFAYIYSVVPRSEAVVSSNNVYQEHLMAVFSVDPFSVFIKPLQIGWVNAENPSQIIPASYTKVITSTGTYDLIENTETQIYRGYKGFLTRIPIRIQVENIRGLASGTYSMNFLFSNGFNTYNYTMSFFIPNSVSITENLLTTYIKPTEEQIFNINSEIKNVVDTQINVTSNTNWRLILDTTNIGQLNGDYSYEILYADGNNIKANTNTKYLLQQGQTYMIAEGTQTYTTDLPRVEIPTFIKIRYYLKNNQSKYFTNGTYTNNLIYRVEEK